MRVASREKLLFLLIYTFFLFLLFSLPGSILKKGFDVRFLDKGVHLSLYLGLGLLSVRAFVKDKDVYFLGFLFSLIYCIIVGSLTELLQCWVPYRSPDWKDWVFNCVGAFIGCMIYVKMIKVKFKQR